MSNGPITSLCLYYGLPNRAIVGNRRRARRRIKTSFCRRSHIFYEREDLEQELQDTIFFLNKATMEAVNNKSGYSLASSLRSTCVAHLLQLVIKDGIKAIGVIY